MIDNKTTVTDCNQRTIQEVRRSEPQEKGIQYMVVTGFLSKQPMKFWQVQQSICILESELHSLLVYQETGDLIGKVALASNTKKPDEVWGPDYC